MTDWFRSWHGAPTDNKWLVIGRKAGVAPGMVSAVFWALCDHASQHAERGTVHDFDVEVYAAFSGFAESDVAAIITALEDKGVITSGGLGAWERRQPKREDLTSSQRSRESRGRKRPDVTSADPGLVSLSERDAPQHIATQRNDREEKKREETEKRPPSPQPPGPTAATGPAPETVGSVLVTLMADEIPRVAPEFTAISPQLSATWLRQALTEAEQALDIGPDEFRDVDIGAALETALDGIDRAMSADDGPYRIKKPEGLASKLVLKAITSRLNDIREQRASPSIPAPRRGTTVYRPVRQPISPSFTNDNARTDARSH